MAHLINKDALLAEIERLYDEKGTFYAADVLYNLKEWLDTIEVEEVTISKQDYEDFIEKACEWLKEYAYFFVNDYTGSLNEDLLIDEFRNYMKGK